MSSDIESRVKELNPRRSVGASRRTWPIVAAATVLMALVIGTRSSAGMFLSPLNSTTGIGLAGLAFAMGIGQLVQGFAQVPLGLIADRFGVRRLMIAGAWLLALATLALTQVDTLAGVVVTMSLIAVAGTAVGSSSLLLAEVGRRVSLERRAMAFAVISAGGSAGQLLIAPATQSLIAGQGLIIALAATALLSLVALPLARAFADAPDASRRRAQTHTPDVTRGSMRDVLTTPLFWVSAGSFGICGFHVGFMTSHMPGVIERCGLSPTLAGAWLAVLGMANIAGSIGAGVCLRHVSSQTVLIGVFSMRASSIALLLALPVSREAMLAFAVLMGLSYMAIMPAISQQVAERFGSERLATNFGVISLVHQVGSFAGVWLGGVFAAMTGSDVLVWTIDLGLAVVAILLQCLSQPADAPRLRLALRLRAA